MGRRPVVQDDARVDGEPRDEVVPHHPAGRAEPEEPIRRPEIVMQRMDLQVLEQDAAVPVDDRLRQPGRARRVEDEERVIEWHRLEAQVALVRGQLLPGHRAVDAGRIGPEVGEDHGRGEAR